MHLKLAFCFAAVVLSGCTHTRETPGDHNLINTSQIQTSQLPAFKDCVSAAFKDRAMLFENVFNRQQIRSNLTRIELVHSSVGAVLSSDIYPDGKAELFETSMSFHTKYPEQKAAYMACVDRFK